MIPFSNMYRAAWYGLLLVIFRSLTSTGAQNSSIFASSVFMLVVMYDFDPSPFVDSFHSVCILPFSFPPILVTIHLPRFFYTMSITHK